MMRLAVTISRRSVLAALAVAALASSPLSFAADNTTPADVQLSGLTVKGIEFPAVSVAPTGQIVITVNLQGDVPQATYVTARSSGVAPLQRAATGQWVAWDGSRDTLVDNRLPAVGGRLTIPVNAIDLSSQKYPTVIFVGYRTAEGIKFGLFNLLINR
jgi:hypothetical protein